MKLLPQTRGAAIRFGVLLGVLAGVMAWYRLDHVTGYYLSDKREGDIVFQSLPRNELVDAIEGMTGSEWSHCGILVRRDGRWMVAESIGEVRYTPLHLWIVRGRDSRIEAWRAANLKTGYEDAIRRGVDRLAGRPYDFHYAPGEDAIYCSELVYVVFDRELGVRIGRWQPMGELNWKPYEAFIREMEGGALPLDRLMITPVELTRGGGVRRVY